MKAIVLGLLLAAGVAEQKCCDQANHEILQNEAGHVAECFVRGGVPVTIVVHDRADHPFAHLMRCEFPIPLQREHLLPQVERQAEKDKEL